MKFRRLFNDPLLRRELWSLAKRRYPKRSWSYPGPFWFLLVTFLVLFLQWEVHKVDSQGYLAFLCFLATIHALMICFRAAVYSAVSMAYDVRQNTIAVLRSTPHSLAWAVLAKLLAVLLPMWLELLAFLPISLLTYGWWGGVPPSIILVVNLFVGLSGLLAGCCGMWLGMLISKPERAASAAWWSTLGLLLAVPAVEWAKPCWSGILGFCLFMYLLRSRSRAQSLRAVGLFAVMTVMLGVVSHHLDYPLRLSAYSPGVALKRLTERLPADELLGPELRQAKQERGLEAVDRELMLELRYAIPREESQRRALWNLVFTGMLYGLIGAAFLGSTYLQTRRIY
ncbi:MAG: hypothetical protein AB7S38_04595 [Vulcanimicrobiota bacterium]